MRFLHASIGLACAVGALGCNGNNVTVGNPNPTGTVGGMLLDAETEMPLSGASVALLSGGTKLTATTDSKGFYALTKVPAGDFVVTITASGYITALLNDTLDGAVGNLPVSNPSHTIDTLELVKSTGTFAVRLVSESGAAAANIKVVARPQVRYFDVSDGNRLPTGSYSVTATSDASGLCSFTGLPDYAGLGNVGSTSNSGGIEQLYVDVPPVAVTATGSTGSSYSYLGGTYDFDLGALGQGSAGANTAAPTISLAGPSTALSVIDSNLDYLRGISGNYIPAFSAPVAGYIAVSGPVTMAFSEAIDRTTIRLSTFDELGNSANVQLGATANSNLLTLMPQSPFTAGARYNVALHVDADDAAGLNGAGREIDTTFPVFAAPTAGNVSVASVKLAPGTTQSFIVTFSEPIGFGYGSAGSISCAVFYEGVTLGTTATAFPGEWRGMDSATACQGVAGTAELDVTRMVPLESSATRMPVTGFSTRWQVTFDDASTGGCQAGLIKGTGCTVPTVGTKVHFVLAKASSPVKHPDGTPVADTGTLTTTIPAN